MNQVDIEVMIETRIGLRKLELSQGSVSLRRPLTKAATLSEFKFRLKAPTNGFLACCTVPF